MGVRQKGRRSGGDGGQIEWKSSEVNTRAVSRGQNELIGEFKAAAGDVISMLIEKDICDKQNISFKPPCVFCGCLSSDLFIFC